MKIQIKKLHPDAVVPRYATDGASAFDLVAIENVELRAGDTKLIKTGLAISVEPGYELQVRPRSGLSLKTPLRVSNSPGTVDSDYRGEVCVIMTNIDFLNYGSTKGIQIISKGDRIAQGAICPVIRVEFDLVSELDQSSRGQDGFGSTGK